MGDTCGSLELKLGIGTVYMGEGQVGQRGSVLQMLAKEVTPKSKILMILVAALTELGICDDVLVQMLVGMWE